MMVQKRDILISVILSIVTCGLYGWLYWVPKIDGDTKTLAGENAAEGLSGIVLGLVCYVTCGFFGIYWAYQMGVKLNQINGNTESSNHIIYAIVAFVCPIVAWGLIQNEVNKHAAE